MNQERGRVARLLQLVDEYATAVSCCALPAAVKPLQLCLCGIQSYRGNCVLRYDCLLDWEGAGATRST